MQHKNVLPVDNHVCYTWAYANAAARTGATGFTTSDVGKLAWQQDNNTFWVLTAATPTWTQLGGGSGDALTSGTLAQFAATTSAQLASVLSDETGSGSAVFSDNATLKSVREVRTAPAISAGALTLDLSTSSVFDVALNGNITTLTISNPAATGTAHGFTLTFAADGTARTVTWPAAVKWPGGTAPTLTSTNGKKDAFVFFTTDGGTTWLGFVAGQNM